LRCGRAAARDAISRAPPELDAEDLRGAREIASRSASS
jgi:hypothetical protein